ncbi:hypothetical protein NIES4103_18530 [Nostoc sp. NIES-4103]|nr:hypothetical protein NIES4103_18530 [Nostoc sp. NIES-4103]
MFKNKFGLLLTGSFLLSALSMIPQSAWAINRFSGT